MKSSTPFRSALAAAALCASFGAFAQTTSAAPSPSPSMPGMPGMSGMKGMPDMAGKHTMDPAKFAEHKKQLLAIRTQTNSCIGSAGDGKAMRSCMKAEHEALKEMHEKHEGMGHPAPAGH